MKNSNDWVGMTEKEVREKFNLSEGDFFDDLELDELAFCDKCGRIYSSYDLNWITAEDFELKQGESLEEEVYKKYDCLCEDCLKHELKDELQKIVQEKIKKDKKNGGK